MSTGTKESARRRFQFHKRSQHFIRAHNETLSVAMRVGNPDCSPVGIRGMSLIRHLHS
jgi:hypothetical protein